MVRVWFNHWFSTSYGIIELMKEDSANEIYVIGSNQRINSVIQMVCDEWYQDSSADGEEYLKYCLDFCREHKVDVFVPRRKMVEISENIERFHEIGVKVMVDNYSIVRILNNKAAAYDHLKDSEGLYIPDYHIVNDVDGFIDAYADLRRKHSQVCVKFVRDEGGMSYRKLTENVDKWKKLKVYVGSTVAYDDYVDTLKEAGSFDDLIVMAYLPGNEISVDCMKTSQGLIAIPRVKGAARHEKVEFDEEILKMTRIIMDQTDLQYPCNIQFKMKDDIPYLLEINTRMSGGLQMSCLAAEVNIPNIALNKLLGREVPWTIRKEERIVSYIEIPQIIK